MADVLAAGLVKRTAGDDKINEILIVEPEEKQQDDSEDDVGSVRTMFRRPFGVEVSGSIL